MQWLPTYIVTNLSPNKESISLTALPYIVNSLVGICKYLKIIHKLFENIQMLFSILVAGSSADRLIQKRWSVLSVRRFMTSIGLIGPGLISLVFWNVHSLPVGIL